MDGHIYTPVRVAGKRATDASTYTGSLLVTKKPKMSNLVEIGEFSRRKYQFGRYKKKTLRRAYTLLKNLTTPIYFRATGSNRYCTTDCGYFKVYNHLQNGLVNYLPVHFWHLTPGCKANAPQLSTGTTNYQCYVDNNPAVTFNPSSHPDGSGGSTNVWTLEHENVPQDFLPTNMNHKWTDIRLLCYGTTTMPVRFDISIVKFHEEMHNPAWIAECLNAGGATNARTVNLYQYLADPFVRNPVDLAPPNEQLRRIMKVVKHTSFVIQTPTTIEGSSAVPHMREVKMFFKMDEVMNHKYKPEATLLAAQYADSLYAIEQDLPRVDPKWNQRYFLMIRAQAGRTSAVGAPTWSKLVNPSYDLTIRHRADVTAA